MWSGWTPYERAAVTSAFAPTTREDRDGWIDEAAVRAWLEDPAGPVAQHVKAEEIVVAARGQAAQIMHRVPEVIEAIDHQMTSATEAIVGIHDEGPISRYLADKEAREHAWLVPAVRRVFPD